MKYQPIANELQRLRFIYGYTKVNELLTDLNFYDQNLEEQHRLLEVIDITLESEQEIPSSWEIVQGKLIRTR